MAIANPTSQNVICDALLNLASQILASANPEEASLRTAISRAYYSVFLTLRDRLFGPDCIGLTAPVKKKLNKSFTRKHSFPPGSHDRILFALSELNLTGAVNTLTLSQQIASLKEARVFADYYFTTDGLKNVPYDTWLEYADKIVALASQLLPSVKIVPSYP